jgi:hypothetical protein
MADQAPPTQVIAQPGMAFVRSPEYRAVYANGSQVRITPWDIALSFSRLTEIVPGLLGQEQIVDVTLGPAQAKAFVISMTETIKAFEEVFGEIKLDPVMMPDVEIIHAIVNNVKEKMELQRELLKKAAMEALKSSKP